jgi:hypothetical protein
MGAVQSDNHEMRSSESRPKGSSGASGAHDGYYCIDQALTSQKGRAGLTAAPINSWRTIVAAAS